MEKTEKQVRVMKRKIGVREFEGTLTIENRGYTYFYPYAKALGDMMTSGDVAKIAKLSQLSAEYCSHVLVGKRWNEEVLRNAEIFAKRNVEMGFVENVEEIICN